jgi:hypothetical protein
MTGTEARFEHRQPDLTDKERQLRQSVFLHSTFMPFKLFMVKRNPCQSVSKKIVKEPPKQARKWFSLISFKKLRTHHTAPRPDKKTKNQTKYIFPPNNQSTIINNQFQGGADYSEKFHPNRKSSIVNCQSFPRA